MSAPDRVHGLDALRAFALLLDILRGRLARRSQRRSSPGLCTTCTAFGWHVAQQSRVVASQMLSSAG